MFVSAWIPSAALEDEARLYSLALAPSNLMIIARNAAAFGGGSAIGSGVAKCVIIDVVGVRWQLIEERAL